MEKPAFPSSCDSTTSTCLQREVESIEKKEEELFCPKIIISTFH